MIYDCFLYYDEDMLLDIRLHTLANVVDRFVIVEATHSFTGKPRSLHFDIEKFAKFKDKIIYVPFDEQPILKNADNNEVDAWANETALRNSIMNGLKNASDDDLILVSDVDEIFMPQTVQAINPKALCTTIHQNVFNYQFNLQVHNMDDTPRKCTLPRATSYYNLKHFFHGEPESFRNWKRARKDKNWSWFKWNWLKINNRIVRDGGWHFSWVMTPERISEKMSTISHTEYDLPEFNNPEHIMKVISNAEDIWGRDRKLVKKEVSTRTLPSYLVENQHKYSQFFL
ncbi:benzoate transporter [Enterobacter chuandaensis]|uniref:benzoate transporter n=1 Tax=Enterobacter chuandaensis TaxID=2497875 RepID=UPI003FD24D21